VIVFKFVHAGERSQLAARHEPRRPPPRSRTIAVFVQVFVNEHQPRRIKPALLAASAPAGWATSARF